MKLRHVSVVLFAIVLPTALFYLIQMNGAVDLRLAMPNGHFYIVSAAALLAVALAAAVGVSGIRLRNTKVILLSLAFVSLAEVFAVHGLSTPGFVMHESHLPGFAAQMSIVLTSLWLCLSSVSSDHPLIAFFSRHKMWLLPVWTVVLAVSGAATLLDPHIVDFLPMKSSPVNGLLIGITIACNLITMYRYYRTYLFLRFPLQIAIVYSAGWLIVSQIIMVAGETWRLSWWLYHFLLLGSMIMMVAGLIRQHSASRSLMGALRALFTNDPIERITSGLSPSVKALVMATESKDSYTAGHNLRVTMYALRLAEEMQAKPELLRAIAQGTIVHDVGKIYVPDAVLNKPGRLTPEERAVIETHPVKGYDMCRSLGFMKEELAIIRSHHERWDGAGYPDKLAGEAIPLVARIVAVADVYDALTSSRSYRQAWTHEEATRYLAEQRGTHFDSLCVDAWVRLCERDSAFYPINVESMNIVAG